MKVVIHEGKEHERPAELFVAGQCLALVIGKRIIRIALSPMQWKLLSKSAGDRGGE
jgi:hypothetical protein